MNDSKEFATSQSRFQTTALYLQGVLMGIGDRRVTCMLVSGPCHSSRMLCSSATTEDVCFTSPISLIPSTSLIWQSRLRPVSLLCGAWESPLRKLFILNGRYRNFTRRTWRCRMENWIAYREGAMRYLEWAEVSSYLWVTLWNSNYLGCGRKSEGARRYCLHLQTHSFGHQNAHTYSVLTRLRELNRVANGIMISNDNIPKLNWSYTYSGFDRFYVKRYRFRVSPELWSGSEVFPKYLYSFTCCQNRTALKWRSHTNKEIYLRLHGTPCQQSCSGQVLSDRNLIYSQTTI